MAIITVGSNRSPQWGSAAEDYDPLHILEFVHLPELFPTALLCWLSAHHSLFLDQLEHLLFFKKDYMGRI